MSALNESDDSDDDYVPDEKEKEVSECESEGDVSDDEVTKSRKRKPENKSEVVEPEEKKKKDDDVWADFMKDTGFKSKKEIIEEKPKTQNSNKTLPEKPLISKAESSSSGILNTQSPITKTSKNSTGLSGVLNNLNKKNKLSTLEKSKLDWDRFKTEENLQEELGTYNRGKAGYLERQDFLNRADLRRFQIEKNLRTIERSKRNMN